MVVIALDRLSKWAVVEWADLKTLGRIDVLPPFLNFRMAWNTGINFGLFGSDADSARWILIALACAISLGLSLWVLRAGAGRWALIATGAVVGGALGNVWDRLVYGAVADFLNMSCCGIDNPFAFNVADAAIFIGIFGLILLPDPKRREGGGT